MHMDFKKGVFLLKYELPEMEIITFQKKDVIKTSPGTGGSDDDIPSVDWD